MDTTSPEFQAALRDHAKSLGVYPDTESYLLDLVQEALLAPVPEDWEQGETDDGTLYYFHSETETSIWEHPLDAHYRELIQTKRIEKEAVPKTEPTAPVSSIEVYSFDEESDEEIKTKTQPVETKSSRISSLFSTIEPVPSYSATSAAMTTSSSSSGTNTKRNVTVPTASGGGFGRDRSWLLDNDEDEVVEVPVASLKAKESVVSTTRPNTSSSNSITGAASSSSTGSFTSRLFGLGSRPSSSNNLHSTTAYTPTITKPTIDIPTDIVDIVDSGKISPHRGIASAIKGSDTVPATSTAVSVSTAAREADMTKIKEMEKKLADALKQLEVSTSEHDKTKQQLEIAKQEAKEANYLKMKLSESKTKLQERENESNRVQGELVTAQKKIDTLQAENDRLQQQQATLSTQEGVGVKKANEELNRVQTKCTELETALEQAQREGREQERLKQATQERLQQELVRIEEQLEKERNQHASALAAAHEQLQSLRQQDVEQHVKRESLQTLSETLTRQSIVLKEVEEKHKTLQAANVEREAQEVVSKQQTIVLENRIATLVLEVEHKEQQLQKLQEQLRMELEKTRAQTLENHRVEDEWNRQRGRLEKENAEFQQQLSTRQENVQSLQMQLKKMQEDITNRQLQQEEATTQLATIRTQLLPLEKQRDQLERELERVHEKLHTVEQDLRNCRHEKINEQQQMHQLTMEMDGWKRKEQVQKTQKDTFYQAKQQLETQLSSLETAYTAYQHEKRLEIDKLIYRIKELESLTTQKEYELVRTEERCTKAEGWRIKEAKRVEEREVLIVELKQELGHLKARQIEAENAVIVHQLRQERDQLDQQLRTTRIELEQTTNKLQEQTLQAQAETLSIQQALERQIPQLAAASVQRASEEWQYKCQQLVQTVREEYQMQLVVERNKYSMELKTKEEHLGVLETKWKAVNAECEFLRKENHQMEETNRVLVEQLHTIRVYLTQRPLGGGGGGGTPTSSPDTTTVHQLNTQLAVLHAQFQQLLHGIERSHTHPTTVYTSSDRFEMPTSPSIKKQSNTNSSTLDQTLDAMLDQSIVREQSRQNKDLCGEQEVLLATLASIGTPIKEKEWNHIIPIDTTCTQWYQKNYWKNKYT